MKKLSKDGNRGFPPGKVLFRIIPLLFFNFVNLSSQTLLNNFGVSEFIKTHSGYTKFTILDYNNDGIEDLFLFGNNEKSFVIHEGLKGSKYSKPVRKFFFFPIDDIKWLTKSTAGEDYYVFVSRNKRLVGLVSFTRSNSLQLLHTIEFNSYPSSIEITDFNNDGVNEVLVYGNNFNGIIGIKNDGYRLVSEPLFDQNVFSDIVLVDFNQDEIDDIIAIDLLNNTLKFLENSELSGFVPNREIEVEETLYSLQKMNLNKDNFIDLIVAKENGIEIIYGDSVFSYTNNQNHNFQFAPDKFIIDDFNLDNKNDLIVSNKIDNKINLYSDFELQNNSYQIEFDGVSDLKVFQNESKSILISLSRKGRIQFISSEPKWNDTFSFSIGGSPNKINYINWKDSTHSSFLVHNSEENSIEILNMDLGGNFVNLSNFSFLNTISEFHFSNNLKYLVGYSKNKRLLEVINYNNNDMLEINQNYHYSTYPIEKILIDNNNYIQILESDGKNLYNEFVYMDNDKYKSAELLFIDSLVTDSQIDSKNQIFYWNRIDDIVSFIKSYKGEKKQLISIVDKDSVDYKSVILNDKSLVSKKLLTILKNEQSENFYLINNDEVISYKNDAAIFLDNEFEEKNIQFYSTVLNQKSLFVYQPSFNRIVSYEFNDKKKSLKKTNSIEAVNINDYFVHQYFGKNYLVYTDKNNNCITYKRMM